MNTNQEERPTPRTDAHQKLDHMAHDHLWSDFARTLERELTAALERAAINARDWQRRCLKTDDAERGLAESRTRIAELESDVTRLSRERDTALSDLEFRRGLYRVLEGRHEALREDVGKCHGETREVLASVKGGSDE